MNENSIRYRMERIHKSKNFINKECRLCSTRLNNISIQGINENIVVVKSSCACGYSVVETQLLYNDGTEARHAYKEFLREEI